MFHPKYTSFLISINIFHGLYMQLYLISFLESCVFVSSIIYHYKLIPNFRNYDIILTNSVILHHFYLYSYHIFEDYLPAIFYILAIGSYIFGCVYNNNIYHGYLHIYGVIANILLKNCLVYYSYNSVFSLNIV